MYITLNIDIGVGDTLNVQIIESETVETLKIMVSKLLNVPMVDIFNGDKCLDDDTLIHGMKLDEMLLIKQPSKKWAINKLCELGIELDDDTYKYNASIGNMEVIKLIHLIYGNLINDYNIIWSMHQAVCNSASNGHYDVLKEMLTYHNMEHIDDIGENGSILEVVIRNNNDDDMVKWLMHNGANLMYDTNMSIHNALKSLCIVNNRHLMKFVIDLLESTSSLLIEPTCDDNCKLSLLSVLDKNVSLDNVKFVYHNGACLHYNCEGLSVSDVAIDRNCSNDVINYIDSLDIQVSHSVFDLEDISDYLLDQTT